MAETTVHERVLPFEGVHNFRDYGGYRVAGGGMLKRAMLFRSAQHRDATARDLAGIGALRLAAVIDLRSDKERAVSPCPRPQGFDARIVFAPDTVMAHAPHVEAARDVDSPDSATVRMCEAYAQIPFRPTFTHGIKGYFEALATAESPTLIHCMAGKDRTGIAVALFHIAMKVHRDDWMADYLLTNVAGNIDERIRAGASHVRQAFGAHLSDDTVRVLMSVRPEFMEAALTAIAARHGGVAGYLADCGVSEATLDAVHRRLLD